VAIRDRRTIADERRPSGDQLEADHAERVDVGCPSRHLVGELLGCGVVQGAAALAHRRVVAGRDGEPQIDQPHTASIDEDVLRLEIGVHHAELVQRVHRGGDRAESRGHARPALGRGLAGDLLRERHAGHPLEHEARPPVDHRGVLEARHQRRTGAAEQRGLVGEAAHRGAVAPARPLHDRRAPIATDRREHRGRSARRETLELMPSRHLRGRTRQRLGRARRRRCAVFGAMPVAQPVMATRAADHRSINR
jgi:hypothetical protein